MTQDAYFSEGISLFLSYGSKCGTSSCDICFTPSFKYEGVC